MGFRAVGNVLHKTPWWGLILGGVVTLALLVLFSRWRVDSGLAGIVVAHVIITFPYSFRAVLAALARYDRQLDRKSVV